MDGGSLRGEGFDRRTDSTGNCSMVEDGLAPLSHEISILPFLFHLIVFKWIFFC